MSKSSFVRSVAKKLKCIKYKGRVCVECGVDLYEKPWLAHFHHRDPVDKSLGIMAALGSSYGLSRVKAELEKCDLMCGHCHAEKHFSVDTYHANKKLIEQMAEKLTFDDYYVSDTDVASIVSLAESGLSMKQIAKETGISSPIVRKHVPALKYGNDKLRKITDQELVVEMGRGMCLRDVAEKYKLGYKTVWKRWRKINEPERSGIAC